MIVVLDEERAGRALDAGWLRCTSCGGRLRAWGFARARAVPGRSDRHRPRRARCRRCSVTHVLHPAACLPRSAVPVETVGAALTAAAAGRGHRSIAVDTGLPASTVRGWLRRARQRAPQLHRVALDFLAAAEATALDRLEPAGSVLADLVELLGRTAAAATRRLGLAGIGPWPIIAALTDGQLIAAARGS